MQQEHRGYKLAGGITMAAILILCFTAWPVEIPATKGLGPRGRISAPRQNTAIVDLAEKCKVETPKVAKALQLEEQEEDPDDVWDGTSFPEEIELPENFGDIQILAAEEIVTESGSLRKVLLTTSAGRILLVETNDGYGGVLKQEFFSADGLQTFRK